MKKFVFIALGIVTATVIFHSDLSLSFENLLNNARFLMSFSIVALTSAYAYFFIHKVLHQSQSDE
jgi:hypothetical protein